MLLDDVFYFSVYRRTILYCIYIVLYRKCFSYRREVIGKNIEGDGILQDKTYGTACRITASPSLIGTITAITWE